MLEPRLQSILEDLCSEGCQQVHVYIQDIETGLLPESMEVLDEPERQLILLELKSIMSVYDSCDI